MGVDSRRPILPAPTDSLVGTSVTPTDLETDISRRTDRTSYSIPEDGKAVTIPLQRQRRDREGSSKLSPSQNSHTSLLIEYFEGGKGSSSLTSRPSVRVRVTPSGARKSRDQKDTVQISESVGSQRPVFTRRISLGSPPSKQKQLAGGDAQSSTSSLSVEDLHASPRPPVEIELMDRDRGSELSDLRYVNQASEISTMPPDSMLDATSSLLRHKRSQSLGREEATRASKDFLKTPSRQRSRSLSKERIAHRVAEKLSSEPRDISISKHRRSGKNRGGSKDLFMEEDTKAPRRKVNRHREIELSSPDSSLLSASVTSSHQRSADQNSYRSSKSSLNNPKLLETVEDAIRRLILPELKELKKDQKVLTNTSKFERDLAPRPLATASSKGELGRRLSKHSSAPDVTRHTSTDRSLGTKDRKPSKDAGLTFVKRGSRPDLTEKDLLRRQKSKSLRDAEAAGRVGTALTAAALSRHDSESTLDHGRSRASRSGTGTPNETELGVNETELVFQKHNVPPMPLNSEIDSGLTRDSLLSEKTAEPSTPARDTRVRDVARGSPAQNASPSPSSRVSHRSPLGFHHSNMSSHNLSFHDASDHDLREHSPSPMSDSTLGSGDVAEAAAANLLGVDPGFHGTPDEHSDFSNRRRTLSPIQSVASGRTEDTQTGHPEVPQGHADSEGERRLEPHLSIESLSSAPSTDLARSTRLGPSMDSRSELAKDEPGLGLGYEESPRPSQGSRGWQDSEAREGSRIDLRDAHHVDDSEVDYLQKVNQGQHVADVRGANPKFFQPLAVESAVASLLDPSVVTSNVSKVPANRSQPDLGNQESQSASRTPQPREDTMREQHTSLQEAPTKQRQDAASPGAISLPKRIDTTSPPQSVAQSIENQEEPEHQAPVHVSYDESPDHEAGHSPETESEINTNPSIIQGPIGGMPHGAQVPWSYDPTSAKANQLPYPDDHELANDQMGYDYHGYSNTVRRATYDSNGFFNQPDDYMGEQLFATPPGAKDEGYVSAANPLSPSIGSPQPASKGLGGLNANPVSLFDNPIEDDLFGATSHQRNLSGYSHGIPSPLYDSATGRGIERIKSKDIVALMDHLTVRDAQRNARDTEILVTLVRSAAEMRNSFEEMKKFIAHQDGLIMETSGKQHEQTQKLIGGPRPLPPSGSRTMRQLGSEEGEDLRTKRRNVFKRALKGLTLKSSNDLTKIEEMLEQLLEEVEALRAVQEGDRATRSAPQAASVDPEGYEPEGRAGTSTSSPGNQSGYFSNSSRPLADSRGIRRDSAHRVSTVHEVDEDMELEGGGGQFSNPSSGQYIARHARAESAPLNTPPKIALNSGSASNETTPKTSEKARKHKSSSSSFFPKISRWSKTTTSSADNTRNSAQPPRKDLPYSDMSRSGSDLAQDQYKTSFYDPHGDDRLRSTHTLDDQRQQQENRPPSPLVPSQVSETPKYRAHRDSLNLQHPQPRQGPSGRYQSQLESQAYDFRSPVSPTSDQWGSNPSLVGPASAAQNRYSNGGHLSPISDAGYSEATSRTGKTPPPPRPPKLRDDGPLVPERPPKVNEDEGSSYVDRVVSRSSAMRSTPPLRKPTGPRPLTSAGGNQYSPGHSKRTRY